MYFDGKFSSYIGNYVDWLKTENNACGAFGERAKYNEH